MAETLKDAIERILDDESAWIARPSDAVTTRIALAAHMKAEANLQTAKPLSEYHEDFGPVVWWRFCRDERPDEASWIGTPNDDDWPGYHTHWTPHPAIPLLQTP